MELRINKEQISHIKIYDYKKTNREWLPEYQSKWFFKLLNWEKYPEGYYKNGKYDSSSFFKVYYEKEELEKFGMVDRDGTVFTKPLIEVYFGKHLILEKYFDDVLTAKKFCNKNFPTVTNIVVK